MQDAPTIEELLEAVAEFLQREVAPQLNDPRLRFRALVSANVLAVSRRELEEGEPLLEAELRRLATLLGDSEPPPQSLTALRARVETQNEALATGIRDGAIKRPPAVT